MPNNNDMPELFPCREAFEKWALKTFRGTRSGGKGMLKRDKISDNLDGYQFADTDWKWKVWQAAWNTRADLSQPAPVEKEQTK